MTKEEKMHKYGLTEADMIADVETLANDILLLRFEIEFEAKPFDTCFATGSE